MYKHTERLLQGKKYPRSVYIHTLKIHEVQYKFAIIFNPFDLFQFKVVYNGKIIGTFEYYKDAKSLIIYEVETIKKVVSNNV